MAIVTKGMKENGNGFVELSVDPDGVVKAPIDRSVPGALASSEKTRIMINEFSSIPAYSPVSYGGTESQFNRVRSGSSFYSNRGVIGITMQASKVGESAKIITSGIADVMVDPNDAAPPEIAQMLYLSGPSFFVGTVDPTRIGPEFIEPIGIIRSVSNYAVNGTVKVDLRLGLKIPIFPTQMLAATGSNGAGSVALVSGGVVGDQVLGVLNVTDGVFYERGSGDFEDTLTVDNEIQQLNVADLSTKALVVTIQKLPIGA